MKHPTFPGRYLGLVAAAVFLGGAHGAEPLALRGIMVQLGADLQAVTDAIAREDWPRVADIAPRIGDHPEPPGDEKARILQFLGADAGRFRGFDEATHHASEALREAAARGDGAAVIAAFADVQRGCLGCHEQFRKPFIEHFYGEH
jgi:hypothetical protein